MKIKPIGERVLVKPLEQEERTKSGLYLPKSSEEKKEAEVVEVGTDSQGKALPLNKGDKVIYGGYSKEDIEIEGKKYFMIEFKDIIAKIE